MGVSLCVWSQLQKSKNISSIKERFTSLPSYPYVTGMYDCTAKSQIIGKCLTSCVLKVPNWKFPSEPLEK